MTTAFRPQGDGVSERLNQTLENYLLAFSNADSDDWDLHLCLAELAYNIQFQAAIQMSPFEADIGYIPRTPATLNVPSTRLCQAKHSEFIASQVDTLAKARRCIAEAQDRMAEFNNKNRQPQNFNVGDEVLLPGQHLAARHLGTTKKKLGARWVGPFEVAKCIGRGYYQLRLPPKLRMHPVFHTSLLKPYISKELRRQRQTVFKVRLADGSEGELVDDIVNYKRVRGKPFYEVKWLGQLKTIWEPAVNLTSLAGLIERYHERTRRAR
ncbi:putative integrase p49 (IN) [CHAIN 6] [Phytophthora infestans]|uniref:Putative integrase p49 (IN) [CHAIN 6] n=1 Tax=Phytophthora infestans TaxID=4787 RepID=A0A8S9UUH8_PHYIN|nr:putative integrase p49 (IN) [CHAIN 6] [Phytophthora infestans]